MFSQGTSSPPRKSRFPNIGAGVNRLLNKITSPSQTNEAAALPSVGIGQISYDPAESPPLNHSHHQQFPHTPSERSSPVDALWTPNVHNGRTGRQSNSPPIVSAVLGHVIGHVLEGSPDQGAAAVSAGKGATILHHAVGELMSPPEESEFVRETPAENATPAAGAAAAAGARDVKAAGLAAGEEASQATPGPSACIDQDNTNNVWRHNLEEAFKEIAQIVQTHAYVAMDTEFPGVVARPYGTFRSHADYQYQTLKCNVDLLQIIQLGLTFSDERGQLHERCTWQFHFDFNKSAHIYAQDSIDLLSKAGVDFEKHRSQGIDPQAFAALMMMSGLTLCDEVRWISFHSYYDFGYLLKLLTNNKLPEKESDFFALLQDYFPILFDIKYIAVTSCENLKGGLNRIAEILEIKRVGPSHQAGSDSLVTCLIFFKMAGLFFENHIDEAAYSGFLYGLGKGAIPANNDYQY